MFVQSANDLPLYWRGETAPGYDDTQPSKPAEPAEGLMFGQAIEAMRAGRKVGREGWNAPHKVWMAYATPTSAAYFVIKPANGGKLQPGWLASQADMLAKDWVVYS